MEFPIERRDSKSERPEGERDIAYKFAARIAKELDRLCRAVVLFGSVTDPEKHSRAGDIDILLVLDDVSVKLTDDLITGYRLVTEQCIREVSPNIHVTTLKFTTFWEYVRVADPVVLNMLRSGEPIIDTGFFEPLQILLKEGRIKPSSEAVWTYYLRAPQTLQNSQWHIMQAAIDLYWAVIDAAHAALMSAGQTPPSPRHAAEMLRSVYVERGLLEEEYARTMEKFYQLSKDLLHRRVHTMSAVYYDDLYAEAKAFVERMKEFLPQQ